MLAYIGHSLVFWKITCFAATLSHSPTKREGSFISACSLTKPSLSSATTSGHQRPVVKVGRRAVPGTGATRNGSRSTGPAAQVMDSNTSSGPAFLAVMADSLAGLLMAPGSAGRLRSIFQTLLNGELSTWTAMAICFWVEKGTLFIVFDPATRKSETRRRRLTG